MFKYNYLELWWPFFQSSDHLYNYGRGYHEEQFCILNFDQEEISFKDISYLELWQPLGSFEWNHLCNFSRRYHEEQVCEIILNLDKWFRRCCLKTFLI